MISPASFVESLRRSGIDFYAGVPDSLLKSMCAYITGHFDGEHNIIAANEGCAVAIAAGHYLATGEVGCVYMQNSGEGNAINPLASLMDRDVYHIPALLVIGWRGLPGVHDEPQHVKQGRITTGLLNVMDIGYEILTKDENALEIQVERVVRNIKSTGDVFALVVEKDTFEPYSLPQDKSDGYEMAREEAIQIVASSISGDSIVVSTTGMISRELFEFRTSSGLSHRSDFLTVGSMGHASQIALGIALERSDRKVYCFDGDGAAIMHMGGMAIIGTKSPQNLVHIVFNNGAHDSVGGQPTAGHQISLPDVARAVGYRMACSVSSREALREALSDSFESNGPVFMEVNVRKGNRKDLGRPTTTPIENKEQFMSFIGRK